MRDEAFILQPSSFSLVNLPRKSFLLRIDPALLDDIQRWANDDLRSLNGQIEFLLRRALTESGRRDLSKDAPLPGEPVSPPAESTETPG